VTQSPDPRFGMQAPLTNEQVTTPAGLHLSHGESRTVTLTNPNDVLSVASSTETTTVNGRVFTSTYTAAQGTVVSTSAADRQSTTTLDAQGRVTQTQEGNLAPVAITYDGRGRVARVAVGTGPTARITGLTYDTAGYLATIVDAADRLFGFEYDPAGRLLSETLPGGRTITYSYDANGNLGSVTPPGRPAHLFDYTAVNLQAQYAPPDPDPPVSDPRTLYSYNLDRQLSDIARPDGTAVHFIYDAAGRLSSVLLPGVETVTYGYDSATGNLTSISGPGVGTVSFGYDGRVLLSETWSGTVAGSVTRTYDNNFHLTSESVSGANAVSFAYDADGLVTTAGAMAVSRDAQSALVTGTTLANSSDVQTYNRFSETETYAASCNGSTLFSVEYTRDALGRITSKTETIGGVTDTFTYAYDLAGRLTDVTRNGAAVAQYAYDDNGNRVGGFTQTQGTLLSASYDNQDRLLAYSTVTGGSSAYTYTANGELATKVSAVGTTTYTYDAVGNLRAVALASGTNIGYLIDGRSRRIGKSVDGVLQHGLLYEDQLRPAAQLDGAGNLVSRFVYATKLTVPDYIVRDGVTYGVISDHLGSVRLVVDTASCAVAQRLDYDEFGNVLLDTNPGFQPFAFAGGLYDPDASLVRFGARDYDPTTGRWSAKDPIDFEGDDTNLYGYVLGDPVNSTDAAGLQGIAVPVPAPAPAPGSTASGPKKMPCITCQIQQEIDNATQAVRDLAQDLANSFARRKGERGLEKGRGDDPFWQLSPEELRKIRDDPASTARERERARKIEKQKRKKERDECP
jgi:RHS repeat-associated protein